MTVKHVKTMTRRAPEKANQIQEIFCVVALFAGGLLGAFGGAAPTLTFVNEKCDLPQPGDGNATP